MDTSSTACNNLSIMTSLPIGELILSQPNKERKGCDRVHQAVGHGESSGLTSHRKRRWLTRALSYDPGLGAADKILQTTAAPKQDPE